jgi:hypothetical protein
VARSSVTSFVCSLPTEADGILGDFLAGKKADLNLEKSQLRLLSSTERSTGSEGQRTRQVKGKTSHGALILFETKWESSREEPVASRESRGKVRSGK